MSEVTERAANIKLVIFDVDGVLTDSSLFIGDDGQEYKAFNSKDGFGMRMLQDCGVEIAILTGRTSNVVKHRMSDLGVTRIMQGHRQKLPAYEELLKSTGYSHEDCAYVGDDVVDLPVMSRVGLSVAVGDATKETKQHAHYVTQANGGRGAAREVCELILRAQNKFDDYVNEYLA